MVLTETGLYDCVFVSEHHVSYFTSRSAVLGLGYITGKMLVICLCGRHGKAVIASCVSARGVIRTYTMRVPL